MSKISERLRDYADCGAMLHPQFAKEATDLLDEMEAMFRKAHGHAMNGHRSPKTKAEYAKRVADFLAKLEGAK